MEGAGDGKSTGQPGETSGQTPPSPPSPPETKLDLALEYLQRVKFQNEQKYNELLGALKDLEDQRIDLVGLITRVKELFRGHPVELLAGFNSFLPEGYGIICIDPYPHSNQTYALMEVHFRRKVNTRFQHDAQTRNAVHRILFQFRSKVSQVHKEVKSLFKEDQDLYDEFACIIAPPVDPESLQ